jgi:signal transduction histidine kinase
MSAPSKPEKDIIRRAFRVLNLQAGVALVFAALLPYLASWNIVDELVTDVYYMGKTYSETIRDEYLAAPGPQRAQELAARHRAYIGFEGPDGFWYSDGTAVYPVNPGERRPYYGGLYNYYDLPDDTRLIVTFPAEFYDLHTHMRVFMSWIGAPLLFFAAIFFLMRRMLYPLRWMQGGINELTQGNFAYEAPTIGRDRNNQLSRKFNAMTASIRALIRSKDQLITDLSHELRSPITRIKVALALVPPDRNLAAVEKNVQELEDIITTILEAQRINLQDIELKRAPCRLAELVRECVDLTQGRMPGIAIGDLDEALEVAGDRVLLKLLTHNLLDNALKYSRTDSKPVSVTLKREEGSSVLTVADDGPGIPDDMLLKVFEPFVKVAPERGFNSGYGLGLSLCRRIVELHGGTIELANQPEGGLRVRVSLPLNA